MDGEIIAAIIGAIIIMIIIKVFWGKDNHDD